MRRHPVKHELLAFAESLVNGRTISAQLGSHIARCRACGTEVDAMRRTLEVASMAAVLEPSREFTAQVLMAGKNARSLEQTRRSRARSFCSVAMGVGYAVALLLIAGAWFSSASSVSGSAVPSAPELTARTAAVIPSPKEIREAAAQIQTFAAAVSAVNGGPHSLVELQQRRIANALDADLMEALAALKRNPGSVRASELVALNVRRQAEAWRALFLQRSS